jgi:protein-S-isoprenylcysteine O-methyltransferase Ste14
MKYRIKLTKLITIILLLVAKPYSWKLFAIGMGIALCGELFRVWTSGHLKKDKELAVSGPYCMVRNPLYVGSFLMAIGFAISCYNYAFPIRTFALIITVFVGFRLIYDVQIKAEERHLANLFGNDYNDYKSGVPSFIPKFSALSNAIKTGAFSGAQMIKNKEHVTVLGFVTIAALIGLKIHFKI